MENCSGGTGKAVCDSGSSSIRLPTGDIPQTADTLPPPRDYQNLQWLRSCPLSRPFPLLQGGQKPILQNQFSRQNAHMFIHEAKICIRQAGHNRPRNTGSTSGVKVSELFQKTPPKYPIFPLSATPLPAACLSWPEVSSPSAANVFAINRPNLRKIPFAPPPAFTSHPLPAPCFPLPAPTATRATHHFLFDTRGNATKKGVLVLAGIGAIFSQSSAHNRPPFPRTKAPGAGPWEFDCRGSGDCFSLFDLRRC